MAPSITPTTSTTVGATLTWTFPSSVTTAAGGTVTFRFYPYGTVRVDPTAPTSSTALSTGTFRIDEVSLYGSVVAASDIPPTVTGTTPITLASNVAPNSNIGLTFSEPVTATAGSFSVSGSTSGTHTFVLSGGPTTYTLNPDIDFAEGETVTVKAFASQITDQDGTPDNLASDYSFSFTVLPYMDVTKIHDIQGSGLSFDPAFGGMRRIEGIVTRAFLGTAGLSGFYVQEEDADADLNASTSEGIFVYDPAGLFVGNEGDKVRITGTVAEFTSGTSSSLTQLSNLLYVENLGASTLPAFTPVNLPVTNVSDLEAYEGMLVTMGATTGNLAVTEYFQLGLYGQLVLAATGASNQTNTDARLDQYTQFNSPSVSGYATYMAELAKRRIYLDDGSSASYPATISFGRGGNPLSASNTLRGGDEVASIMTVLDERFEGYRLQTKNGVNFQPTNARPVAAPAVGGTLRVASANVLNYFNGNGLGGGFPTARGATTLEEFNRQRAKVLQNLLNTGADIIGLMEVENDGYGSASAIQDLVNGLNTLTAPGTYTFVNPGTIATDAITVAMIYKPGVASAVGAPASLSTNADFNGVGRRPLAQTFQQIATGEILTVVVNHFKSKGSSQGGAGDTDIVDGQGASNGTRTRQAQALTTWLAGKPTGTNDPDYLIIGDLNSYAKEDPITFLEGSGFGNLLPTTSYSYVFDGQFGSLDHALATSSLAAQVTGAEKWHINSDEPTILDYNTEYGTNTTKPASLYAADQFRSSDHDPVVIGFNLVTPADLVPIIYARPTVQNGPGDVTVVVDVLEINNVASSGLITVKVSKDTKISLTMSGTATSVNNRTVQNSVWTFDGTSDLGYYVLTTSQPVAAGDRLSFGLEGTLTPNTTTGSLTINSVVLGNSGGETKVNNNIDVDKIEYFQQ
ncbi:ExeM/NucH family extracellular endonuclease [Spirosoma validum]|nr:ExeM/NucH family extracellular endonuclease [Spirosoma validum]